MVTNALGRSLVKIPVPTNLTEVFSWFSSITMENAGLDFQYHDSFDHYSLNSYISSHYLSLPPPLIGTFTWPTPPGPYRATTCRGEGIKQWITYILFWPYKDMEGLPGWVISPMPEPPPRQHKHERQYTPSTHSVIPTSRIWKDDDDGQMIFGDLGGLKFHDICLTGEGKNPKKPHPGNLSRPGIEPGPAAWQAQMLPLAPQRWTNSYIS